MILQYGGLPVPYTVAWSGETEYRVGPCKFAGGNLSICQADAQGVGRPVFGRPHYQRQRQTISKGWCDLCAKPLAGRTKVSVSDAGLDYSGADGSVVLMQAEPLLHKECAAESLKHCPHLRKFIEQGKLRVKQVTKHRAQFQIVSPEWIRREIPGYTGGEAIGWAKVELQRWIDRDLEWLDHRGNDSGKQPLKLKHQHDQAGEKELVLPAH